MGIFNPRAFCPACGAKIHTHEAGLGRRTGTRCPECGVALTGKVRWHDNMGELARPVLARERAEASPPPAAPAVQGDPVAERRNVRLYGLGIAFILLAVLADQIGIL